MTDGGGRSESGQNQFGGSFPSQEIRLISTSLIHPPLSAFSPTLPLRVWRQISCPSLFFSMGGDWELQDTDVSTVDNSDDDDLDTARSSKPAIPPRGTSPRMYALATS
jgi:hypothetical protein